MQHVELTAEEMEALRDLLQHQVDALDVEEHRTDSLDFKAKLREETRIYRGLLAKMAAAPMLV
jgi:hypothetical protein